MHKISIKNKTDNSVIPTHVSIDGHFIRATSVNFSQSVDTIPVCEIEVYALPDIEALADIEFCFSPKTVQESAKILRHAFLTDEILYSAFVDGIKSALRDLPEESDIKDAAELVASRIIGEK